MEKNNILIFITLYKLEPIYILKKIYILLLECQKVYLYFIEILEYMII